MTFAAGSDRVEELILVERELRQAIVAAVPVGQRARERHVETAHFTQPAVEVVRVECDPAEPAGARAQRLYMRRTARAHRGTKRCSC